MAVIALFGASGYLGSLIAKNYRVVEIDRLSDIPSKNLSLVIDASFPPRNLWQREGEAYLQTIGSRSRSAQIAGIPYVYLASMSSVANRCSFYAARKFEAESIALEHGGTLIRLGLVTGIVPRGRYKELLDALRVLPVIPSPHPLTFPLFVTPESEFIATIDLLAHGGIALRQTKYVAVGTKLSSLGATVEILRPYLHKWQSVVSLPHKTSTVMQKIAARLHLGPLDSLSSIALMGEYGWRDDCLTKKIDSGSDGD